MPQLPTAAIIGAGSSGIAAAKALHERGIAFDCFEASDRVGGNWVFGNRNGMSAAYRDLHINTSRDRMQFSDFPMPRSLPGLPAPHADRGVLRRLRRPLRLPRPDPLRDARSRARELRADGTWELTDAHGERARLRHARSSPTATTGTRAGPSPRSPAATTFEGIQMHAHDYRDNAFLAGKDVVVLGMGNSAMDIAVESSYVARVDAPRRPPRRVDRAEVPLRQAAGPARDEPPRARAGSAREGRRSSIAAPAHRPARALRPAQARPPLQRGAPDGLGPDPRPHRARRDHAAAEHRAARPRLGAVHRRHARARRRRHLLHGLPHQLPVLRRRASSRRPTTASSCFAASSRRSNPSLAFVGLLQPIGAIMPLAEAQGRLLADYLRGAYRLPSRARDAAPTSAARTRAMRKRYVASKRHTIQVDFDRYLLRARARAPPRRRARAAAAGLRCRRAAARGAARRRAARVAA